MAESEPTYILDDLECEDAEDALWRLADSGRIVIECVGQDRYIIIP